MLKNNEWAINETLENEIYIKFFNMDMNTVEYVKYYLVKTLKLIPIKTEEIDFINNYQCIIVVYKKINDKNQFLDIDKITKKLSGLYGMEQVSYNKYNEYEILKT